MALNAGRQLQLSGAADGHAARGAALKFFVTGFFPLARAFGHGRSDESKYKNKRADSFHFHLRITVILNVPGSEWALTKGS